MPTPPSEFRPTKTTRRRLADLILEAFFLACEEGALDLAADLFRASEAAVRRLAQSVAERRSAEEALIHAFEHLWFLRDGPAGQPGSPALSPA